MTTRIVTIACAEVVICSQRYRFISEEARKEMVRREKEKK